MSEPSELATLVDAYLDQTISEDQRARLESLLTASPEARAEYWTLARLHGQIHEACAAHTGGGMAASASMIAPRSAGKPAIHTGRPAGRIGRVVAIAAAVVIAGVCVALVVRSMRPVESPTPSDRLGPSVAVLLAVDGTAIQADGSGNDLNVGEAVRRGSFSIGDGRVELAFDDGSSVAITGPARFRIDGPDRAQLASGRLSASAKSGFTVVTPRLRVVDLGTAFSVVIDDDGATHVQVFRGRVRVEPIGDNGVTESRVVEAWQAIAIDQSGKVAHGLARAVDAASIPSDDPLDRLVAWYRFDGDASNAAHESFAPASVSHVRFVEGHTGGAAEFDGSFESWIDLPIDATPEAMPKLTWGAWVKPTEVEGQHREVLSTDWNGYRRALTLDPRSGTTQTPSDGGRFHAAAFGGSAGVVWGKAPAIDRDQWRFIAGVYDSAAAAVTVFCDDPATGKLVSTTAGEVRLRGGRSVIRVGNHATASNEAFAGLIDEVFVFADALSAEQVEAIRSGVLRPSGEPAGTTERHSTERPD